MNTLRGELQREITTREEIEEKRRIAETGLISLGAEITALKEDRARLRDELELARRASSEMAAVERDVETIKRQVSR